MGGGILQIVAKGVEDIFITDEPHITFFKTIYRRHTNFTRDEHDISFSNRLDFGKVGRVKIRRNGDLLHRLFLVITLPDILITFRSLTVGEVKELLAVFGIEWETERPDDQIFRRPAFEEVLELIDIKVEEIDAAIAVIDEILLLFTGDGEFVPDVWFESTGKGEEDVDDYMSDVIDKLFEFDRFNIEYQFIQAQTRDSRPPLQTANSDVLQLLLFEKFVRFGTGQTVPGFDPSSYNDENLFFFYNVDTANYVISGSLNQLDSNTVFRSGIANVYGDQEFEFLDAYKIFDESLNQGVAPINNNFDVEVIKDQLLENIIFGLVKNIRQLIAIYNSLQRNAKFMFYRLFQRVSGGFDTNAPWNNLSLFQPNDPNLDDQFTSDFDIPPEPNEPSNLFHPMSAIIDSIINDFHINNRTLFRDTLYKEYFDALFLWERTDVGTAERCIEEITGSPNGTIPQEFFGMYFMNYIPFLSNEDIPQVIVLVLEDARTQAINEGNLDLATDIQLIIDTMEPLLATEKILIDQNLNPKICNRNDFVTMQSLDEFARAISGPSGDIVNQAFIRQDEFLRVGGQEFILPEWVVRRYLRLLNNFSDLGLPSYELVKPTLDQAVNLFITPEDEIPPYGTFQNNNFNLSDLQINTPNRIFSDAISSIWWNLFRDFVSNYDSLYDDQILGRQVYEERIGIELLDYLVDISISTLGFDPANPQPIEYYFKSTQDGFQGKLPALNGEIGIFLNEKLAILQEQIAFFDQNVKLLTMRDLIIPKAEFYFEKFNLVLDFITLDNLETLRDSNGVLVYDHSFHDDPDNVDPVLDAREGLINPAYRSSPYGNNYNRNEPHDNAIDITDNAEVQFEKLIASSINPFSVPGDINKFRLWNDIWLPEKSFSTPVERSKYEELFGFISAETLWDRVTEIDVNYNGFAFEDDIYNFMRDVIIENSTLRDIPGLAGDTVTESYNNILDYYQQQKLELQLEKRALIGTDGSGGLVGVLENALNAGRAARFAWIKKIGHYLIDEICLKIGDQLIDKHYGEWLEIWHQLIKRDQKERGYKILIGDVPQLTTFDTTQKREYELIVPLQFWFCRAIGGSLPLVALQNTTVELFVKFKKFSEVAYFEDFTQFRAKPKVDCKLLAEYIYVDQEERDKIVNAKHEYLIEKLQYNGNVEINAESFIDQDTVNTRVYFQNLVKEMYWVVQRSTHVDGSQTNGERKYDNYGYDFDTGFINPIKQAKINFSSRDREPYHDAEYYNFIQPYERHYSTPQVGINTYSFGLEPEKIQPSGSANLGRIDDAGIEIILKDRVKDDVVNNGVILNFRIYATSYNILRIMSGLAGILYFI